MPRPFGPGLAALLLAVLVVAGVATWFGMTRGDAPANPPANARYNDTPQTTGTTNANAPKGVTGYPANPAMPATPPAQPRTGGGG
jgi:hypothetical protein